jgi:phospholipid-binding lipoprotein MlaA
VKARHRRQLATAMALVAATAAGHAQAANDPFESWNRGVFAVNEELDAAILKPVATAYTKVVPELARAGVTNFFNNFRDGWSAINHLLQGKPVAAAEMGMRVATNALFGIGGIFDPATDLGMERRREDFGQTLGRWGLPAGPYLVLPLLGPSSLRDTAGLPLDLAWATGYLTNDSAVRVGLTVLELVDLRAGLLGATRVVDEIALDKYVFIRDGYLTRRRSMVYDGDPPDLPDADDDASDKAPQKASDNAPQRAPDPPK